MLAVSGVVDGEAAIYIRRLGEPSVVVRQREPVFVMDLVGSGWDLHPDGDRFIVTEGAQTAPAPQGAPATSSPERYLIVLNWFEESKERVGN